MVTAKPFNELTVGDYIADMHDGAAQLKERFNVVASLRWDEAESDEPGFSRYLSRFVPHYTNKQLVVIGFTDDSTLTSPELTCGYSYDGRRCGIVVLRPKL